MKASDVAFCNENLVRTVYISVETLDLPLISTAIDSPCCSVLLEPDKPSTIGRSKSGCQFVFEDRRVSKRHCQVFFNSVDKKIYIIDGVISSSSFTSFVDVSRKRLVHNSGLEKKDKEAEVLECCKARGSLNGVFVNGFRIKKKTFRELCVGDEVLLVCGSGEGVCCSGIRVGFLVMGIVFNEVSNEIQLGRPGLFGRTTSVGQSQGSVSAGKRNKRVFACRVNDVMFPSFDISVSKRGDLVERVNSLLSQCKSILNSGDPISCSKHRTVLKRRITTKDSSYKKVRSSLGLKEEDVKLLSTAESNRKDVVLTDRLENMPYEGTRTDQTTGKIENLKTSFDCTENGNLHCSETVGVLLENAVAHGTDRLEHRPHEDTRTDQTIGKIENIKTSFDYAENGNLHHNETARVFLEKALAHGVTNSSSLNFVVGEYASQSEAGKKKPWQSCFPPGKKFHLNRLEFMPPSSSGHRSMSSLPELFHPIESITQIFVATFTSDISWFLSYCQIPFHLPVTIACHNSERCWSPSSEDRTCMPYPDYPNLVVVYPPFPEAIAFGKDTKKRGIACHHPKLFVLQRKEYIRVIVSSANLNAKQWNSVTNTIWWQDFPRRSRPDYSSLLVQIGDANMDQDSKSDFAAQLAGFMASLVIDVPSQAHWIVELANYDFGEAVGYLVASVPGIHSYRNSYMSEFIPSQPDSLHSNSKLLGAVEAHVVGLSHLFRSAADSNGARLKKLAAFLKKSHENNFGLLEIVLRRNINVPADANAVSILVPNPDECSGGRDYVPLGFLPRQVAKWVSPLWDVGFFRFCGYISPEEALEVAVGGTSTRVPLILYISQNHHFSDMPNMFQQEHVIAFCSLIASIQRYTGLRRLQEVLCRYKWPESQESEIFYGASSIGSSVNPQFVAAFSTAVGKKSVQHFDSDESDPEWGCWTVSQESKLPSIRIIFPTVERVKNAHNGILPSKRILCFQERTWQRLRTVNILHDAIPHPPDRVGHPMHVKVAWRRFQSKPNASSCGWVYCGSHNFSPAAWGRPVSNRQMKTTSSLHVSNYELGIVFVYPPAKTRSSDSACSINFDEVEMPFVVPPPKYGAGDKPATMQAMRVAMSQLSEQARLKLIEIESTEALVEEEMSDEEEEVIEVDDDYVEEDKQEEKVYAEMLWSQVDESSQSSNS